MKLHFVWCLMITAAFMYAGLSGRSYYDIFVTGEWAPQGAAQRHYHK